jgi:hypothetical protein
MNILYTIQRSQGGSEGCKGLLCAAIRSTSCMSATRIDLSSLEPRLCVSEEVSFPHSNAKPRSFFPPTLMSSCL